MSNDKMLEFSEIQAYVDWWMASNNVKITSVHKVQAVNKDGVNNNWCVVNGIKMRVWIDDNYPTNLLNLKDLCCADSGKHGYKISANQAKVATKRYLFETGKEVLAENQIDDLFA